MAELRSAHRDVTGAFLQQRPTISRGDFSQRLTAFVRNIAPDIVSRTPVHDSCKLIARRTISVSQSQRWRMQSPFDLLALLLVLAAVFGYLNYRLLRLPLTVG